MAYKQQDASCMGPIASHGPPELVASNIFVLKIELRTYFPSSGRRNGLQTERCAVTESIVACDRSGPP